MPTDEPSFYALETVEATPLAPHSVLQLLSGRIGSDGGSRARSPESCDLIGR